jgi:hypothetical protein
VRRAAQVLDGAGWGRRLTAYCRLMRSALGLLVAALVVACTSPAASPSPSPSPTVTATATEVASPAPSAVPGPSVFVTARPVPIPSDPHYIVSWSTRLLLLDPAAKTATAVAAIDVRGPTEPGYPYQTVSNSRDGRVLLLTVVASPTHSSLFLIRPESGEAHLLLEAVPLLQGMISPDGSRFAFGRNDLDATQTGLWIGRVADRSMRRVIAEDPQFRFPPVPLAFSADNATLVFGIGNTHLLTAGLIPTESPELRVDRSREPTVPGATMIGFATAAEFTSPGELFVSSSGQFVESAAFTYELARRVSVELHRSDLGMEAKWRPGAQTFATLEHPRMSGANPPGVAWLRGRDRSAQKLRDVAGGIGGMWWSRDGTKLYALVGGDDSNGGVVDLLTGSSVMSYCIRGGTPGACI